MNKNYKGLQSISLLKTNFYHSFHWIQILFPKKNINLFLMMNNKKIILLLILILTMKRYWILITEWYLN